MSQDPLFGQSVRNIRSFRHKWKKKHRNGSRRLRTELKETVPVLIQHRGLFRRFFHIPVSGISTKPPPGDPPLTASGTSSGRTGFSLSLWIAFRWSDRGNTIFQNYSGYYKVLPDWWQQQTFTACRSFQQIIRQRQLFFFAEDDQPVNSYFPVHRLQFCLLRVRQLIKPFFFHNMILSLILRNHWSITVLPHWVNAACSVDSILSQRKQVTLTQTELISVFLILLYSFMIRNSQLSAGNMLKYT